MANNSNEELSPLGKFLAFVGFFAGFSAVWQNNQEFWPAFIGGVFVAILAGFIGNVVWRLLIVAVAVIVAIGSFYVRHEVTSAIVHGINESSNYEAPQVTSQGSEIVTDQPQAGDLYGAIYLSPTTYATGSSWNYSDQASAMKRAEKECLLNASSCVWGVWFKNGCGAIASDKNGTWQSGWSATLEEAKQKAISSCNTTTSGCVVLSSACTTKN